MKKLISMILLLAMVLGLFAGCGSDEEKKAPDGLQSAAEYLSGMYQTAGKDQAIVITADQDVLKSVVIDGVSYTIVWTVEVTEGAADSVTVGESTKENHAKLDIPLHSGSDILFTATATISDDAGNNTTVSFNYKVAGVKLAGEGMTMQELVAAAYALDEDTALDGLAVLTGKVTMINTPYDDGYKNLTCTIVVEDCEDMPIKCYRLKGDGAENLAIGDIITVSGTLKNYGGTIEFDAGCMIDELKKNDDPAAVAPDDPMQIVQDAYNLEAGSSLAYEATLTGTIVSIDTPYDSGYQNVTVTITVAGCEDKPIKCYRLKGEGADRLAVDTVITVTGILMNYNGTIEFAQGCTLDAIVSGEGLTPVAPDPLDIVNEAYTLAIGASLPYTATLTGVITSVDQGYDATYQNITVTMTITGQEQKPIQCFRMKGNGADTLAVGDTITVTGIIKNYNGKIQFDVPTLTSVVKGVDTNLTKPATEVEIVDQAYKLQRNQALPYVATVTGKVSFVKEAYNSQYKNITVVIKVPGRENRPLVCYRMKGTDVDKVAVNDTITVTGTIKNYNGSIQFDTGCNMDKRVSGGGKPVTQETDPQKIVDIAYGLAENAEMSYDVILTGKVTEFNDVYTDQYKSISVVITVAGRESKPIILFGLKGDDVTKVAVGDTVTATGRLKNYYGDVEMTNCTLTGRVSGGGKPPVVETEPNKILAAGSSLANNKELPYDVTLTGKVMNVNEPYTTQYQNVTVTIAVNGTSQELKIYRLKGTGVEKVKMGDTITVVGRIKKYNEKLELVSGEMTKLVEGNVKVETDYTKIVDEAYALAQGKQLEYTATLKGKITELQSPYDSNFKNMTVAITVAGREDKPILCYRMKGDNIGNHLCVGDTITVTGIIKNYNGTIEFDAGCQMTDRQAGSVSKPTDSKKIVDAAFALGENAVLPYFATLTGKVKSIEEPYTSQYKNVTLTLTVEGSNGQKDIICYRLKGDAAETVAVGNTITVTGAIKRFVRDKDGVREDKVEFDSGCVIESLQKSGSMYVYIPAEPVVSGVDLKDGAVQPRAVETNVSKIMTEAFALASGDSLSYEATLTGKITSIKDPYNSSYKNVSVIIAVPGYESKPLLCYRIKGDGADKLAVGDTITVTGTIINYNGTIEFGAGSTLDKVVSGGGVAAVAPEDPKQIVDEAFALGSGEKLPYSAKLTGKIVSIDNAYDATYKNITVTIEVEGSNGKKDIECYRLKGTGAENLKVGDVIVVEGIIQRYVKTDSKTGDILQDKVEFNAPSLIEVNPENSGNQGGNVPAPTATKLYCEAPASWTQCYIYTWDASGAATTGAWPGTQMTKEADGLWSYEIPAEAANVIFNDGNGTQTVDMVKPADNKVKYVYETGAWEALTTGGDEGNAPTTTNEIIDAAYALADGETLDGTYTLSGQIVSIDNPYDSSYKNITVTIKVPGSEDKPIKCYRLAGEGAEGLLVDDYITVTGSLTNYKGSIQFAQGCTLDKVISGGGTAPVAPSDPKQIVEEAYALAEGAALPYKATLTGKITEVGTYNETYGDITVKIVVEGKEFECYALKGEGVAELKVGDVITVSGTIKNYYGKIEFDKPDLVVGGNTGDNSGNTGDNSGNTGNNSGNTGNNSGNTDNNSGNTGNTGDKAPGTGDYAMTGIVIVMVVAMAAASLMVLSKKKFYC